MVHVEARDELVADGVCHALDDGVTVWWVVAEVVGEGVGVDGRVRGGELGDAAGAADGDTEAQQLTWGGGGRAGV